MSTPDTSAGLNRLQRREFVDAFVEQTWKRPDADRPVARVHVAVLVATLSAVAAVAVGVVLHLVHPTKAAAGPPQVPVVRPYSAVSGWDCGTSADHGFDANGRTPEWVTVPRGGWPQDACHGTFESIPMSGNKGKDSQNQYVAWWFMPNAGTTRCELMVYLPASDNPLDSAGTAARFLVLAGRNGTEFAEITVDQTKGRGSWKSVGTFPVSQGGLALEMVNRGAPANPRARLSATQVRATCNS